ncbi:MAG TPA: hypothetical protein DDY91_05005 [Planctomycetaceae bacterium]|nr:hypothetical protein [Planctomycetaceae bacterium]
MSARRKKPESRLLGNHQRSWLWGRNLVRETVAAGEWPILELWLADDLPRDLSDLLVRQVSLRWGCEVQRAGRDVLERLCHDSAHQGCLARMGPFPYRTLDQLLDGAAEKSAFLVLDGIQDSFNLGAILRSAQALGIAGLLLGTRGQSPITSQAARSSAGAVNRLPIAQVESLPTALGLLRSRGIRILGTDPHAGTSLPRTDLTGSLAVVVGNESQGISAEVWECCDDRVRIPLGGEVESLNAAAAATIVCYERLRQNPTDC